VDLELAGKVAVVTGGARGIGKAIALRLAREGCRVAISSRDADRLSQTVEETGASAGRAIGILVDVSSP